MRGKVKQNRGPITQEKERPLWYVRDKYATFSQIKCRLDKEELQQYTPRLHKQSTFTWQLPSSDYGSQQCLYSCLYLMMPYTMNQQCIALFSIYTSVVSSTFILTILCHNKMCTFVVPVIWWTIRYPHQFCQ